MCLLAIYAQYLPILAYELFLVMRLTRNMVMCPADVNDDQKMEDNLQPQTHRSVSGPV